MKVLVACEYSGRVREAFRRLGHDAWSYDLLPADDNSPYHVQGDVLNNLNDGWDIIIAHPPCTDLSSAGASRWPQKQLDGRQKKGVEFVLKIANADCPKIVIENPVGFLSTAWRKPDQIINPFQFGEAERKRTCLWIKGLPLLVPTDIVEVKPAGFVVRKSGAKIGKYYYYYYHQGKNAHERSKTFQGIAAAMGAQWGAAPPNTQDQGEKEA